MWFSLAALLIVLLGLVQKYWAARVAIDAELFSLLATKNHPTEEALAELDYALQQLSLAPITEHTRSLEDRGRGALRLLRWQLIFFSTQVIFIVAACGAAQCGSPLGILGLLGNSGAILSGLHPVVWHVYYFYTGLYVLIFTDARHFDWRNQRLHQSQCHHPVESDVGGVYLKSYCLSGELRPI